MSMTLIIQIQLNKFKSFDLDLQLKQIIRNLLFLIKMNWLPLRKNNIPLIDRQVEKALKVHNQIQESILQGDILSIQKMSEFQLSIKKRVQEIDQFYNKNCLDERVRFLQAARMKLSRIINQSTLNQKQMSIGLPWKQTNDISGSRQSNSSSKKSITPRKKTLKTEIGNIHRQTALNQKQQRRSPLNRTIDNSQVNQGTNKSKKIALTLKIPEDDDQNDHITFSREKMTAIKTQSKQQEKLTKSRRKMEYIPSKNRSSLNTRDQKNSKSPINIGRKTEEENKQNNPKIKISQPPGAINSSRSRATNNSAIRTAEANNGNSIKLLNDLIFTIKMTKDQYQDFIEIKKQLNRR